MCGQATAVRSWVKYSEKPERVNLPGERSVDQRQLHRRSDIWIGLSRMDNSVCECAREYIHVWKCACERINMSACERGVCECVRAFFERLCVCEYACMCEYTCKGTRVWMYAVRVCVHMQRRMCVCEGMCVWQNVCERCESVCVSECMWRHTCMRENQYVGEGGHTCM